ncbi:MAG: hypothetical protein ABSB87_04105 [Terriglobales bacterium]
MEPESAIYKKANISMNVITQFPVVTDRDPDLRFQVAFESVAIGMASMRANSFRELATMLIPVMVPKDVRQTNA